ncbi:MAG: HlyC/CorC family transporter [Proteobacteria bacterium]|nr:HlyC/CorC family transporter [Pseudomonadota bacterium]
MSLTHLTPETLLLIMLVLTVLSAFFSSSETAMMALNRYRLRHLVNEGHAGARKADKLLRRPDRLLSGILIGNNLVNFSAATVATVLGLQLFGDLGVMLSPVVLTIYFLIFAEVAPKTIAANNPERLAFRAVYVLDPLLKFMLPALWSINRVSNLVARPFMKHDDKHRDHLSMDELRTVVNEGSRIPDAHQDMLISILDLENVTVDDIMVPRSEIVGIDADADLSEIIDILANSQHTRLPVYRGNMDNVIGILHLRRMSRFINQEGVSKEQLLNLVRKPYYVPEATPLHTQLLNFKNEKRRVALVVDEYGDVRGIVTLEDILEEIVGEFTTDFAASMPEIVKQEDDSYVIDGRAVLRDINRALAWDLPTDGPKTLNGLLLEELETIPDSNLCIRIGDYRFETMQITDNSIKNVKIMRDVRPLLHDEVEARPSESA